MAKSTCQPPRIAGGRTSDGRIAISLPEYAALYGASESWAYRAAKEGLIPTLRVGGRIFVRIADIADHISGGAA